MNERHIEYDRILFYETLKDMVRSSQYDKPTYEDFKSLRPIKGVYGAYSFIPVKYDIGEESHTLAWDWDNTDLNKREESRRSAIDEINQKIMEHNDFLDDLNPGDELPKVPMFSIKKWLLQGYFVTSTTKETNPNIRDNPRSTFLFDSEFIYKKALMYNRDEITLTLNKMIYEYIVLISPKERTESHLYTNAILEFENWFTLNGFIIDDIPNLLDMKGKGIITNPVAYALEKKDAEIRIAKNEMASMAKALIRKKKRASKSLVAQRTLTKEELFKNLVDKNELDKLINDNRLIFKESGKVNWKGLAEELGIGDGRTVLKYAKKYATYLVNLGS